MFKKEIHFSVGDGAASNEPHTSHACVTYSMFNNPSIFYACGEMLWKICRKYAKILLSSR